MIPFADLRHGDCREIIATLDDNSIDAIVTDPPYELGFMGKKWDNTGIAYDIQLWTQCLRVLKPGGHLLAFGGTRTYHRMACAIEDAGFEIRDSIHWLYGSGFPKSHDVSKAIDKAGGVSPADQAKVLRAARKRAEMSRADVAIAVGCTEASVRDWEDGRARKTGANLEYITPSPGYRNKLADLLGYTADERRTVGAVFPRVGDGSTYGLGHGGRLTAGGNTDAAREWEGWGTALKPAHEPIVLARKPLIGTVAANVLQHGTGALNIDGTRVDMGDEYDPTKMQRQQAVADSGWASMQSGIIGKEIATYKPGGRWPANVITDGSIDAEWVRYFYCAKPSKAERNAGLDALPEIETRNNYGDGLQDNRPHTPDGYIYKATTRNTHPTVKPLALMRYLVRLVTPPGGTVLEPFAGSGTTLAAAILEGFNAIGCELTADYLPIIEGRIAWAQAERAKANDSLFGDAA